MLALYHQAVPSYGGSFHHFVVPLPPRGRLYVEEITELFKKLL